VITRRHADALALLIALGGTLFVALWAGLIAALALAVAGPLPGWVGRGLVWCWLFLRLGLMIGEEVRRLWRG
jgi:hypothetical protein